MSTNSYEELPDLPRFPLLALARLSQLLTVVLVASLLPYSLPALRDYQYWDRLSVEPLRLAVRMESPPVPVVAAAAKDETPPPASEDEEAIAEAEVDAAMPPVPPAAEAGMPGLPVPDEATANAEAALVVTDEQLGDQKVWVEGNPHALDGFVQAMAEMAAGKRAHVRIAHYGDSHMADDGITDITRRMMQRRFGDGGHGFVLVHARTNWYRHRGVKRTASDGWKITNFLNGNGKDGAYGYGGVAVEGGPGETFSLDSQKHAITKAILYYRSEGRATVAVKVDGKAPEMLTITAPAGVDGMQEWHLPRGPHSVSWRIASGKVRFFGGAFETDRGLIYDSLGEVGARGTRWLQANEAHMATILSQRNPDLVILNYGGNERIDKITEAQYLERMQKVVHRFVFVPERDGQAQPARSCLLIGPGDHGVRKGGRIVSDLDIIRIIDWQRKLAKQTGCGFWDARAVMGGEGAMGRWVASGLGWADYAHFSPKGEAFMGVATYRALLHALKKASAIRPELRIEPVVASLAPPSAQPPPAEPARVAPTTDGKTAEIKASSAEKRHRAGLKKPRGKLSKHAKARRGHRKSRRH